MQLKAQNSRYIVFQDLVNKAAQHKCYKVSLSPLVEMLYRKDKRMEIGVQRQNLLGE